jgi:threonine dehydrogenase-like Zn-dependent dehydrogenase
VAPADHIRAVSFVRPQVLGHTPRERAVVRPDEVRVSVAACGICGSDIAAYAGLVDIRAPGTVMGHEAAGVITEVGADVTGLAVGDRVAIDPIVACGTCEFCAAGQNNLCRTRRLYGCTPALPGAYADEVVVGAVNAVPLPDGVPLEVGALVEPLSVGRHAVDVAARLADDPARVLVIGGGPIGLAAALAARADGLDVLLSEPQAERRAVAGRFGLDAVAPEDVPDPGAWPVAVDAVGITPTLDAAVHAIRPQGLVVFVGLGQDVVGMPGHPMETGERRIAGSAAYTRDDVRRVIAWADQAAGDLAPLTGDVIGFADMDRVFAAYADRSRSAVKTLLMPSV